MVPVDPATKTFILPPRSIPRVVDGMAGLGVQLGQDPGVVRGRGRSPTSRTDRAWPATKRHRASTCRRRTADCPIAELSWVVKNGTGPVGAGTRANSTVRPSSAAVSSPGRRRAARSVIGQRLGTALPTWTSGRRCSTRIGPG
jgi:hypothetical protein